MVQSISGFIDTLEFNFISQGQECSRAVDLHSFHADPDPAVFLNADPDPDPDPGPGLA